MLAIFILPLVGAVLMTVIGFVWYGPLFGKSYMAASGMAAQSMDGGNKKSVMTATIIEFVMSFIMLFGFLTMMNLAYAGTYTAALVFAALFWFFFMMTQKASSVLWTNLSTKSKWTLFGLGAGYSLVSLVIVAPVFLWLIQFFV